VTTGVQHANAGAAVDDTRQTRASYRGDVIVTLPGGTAADVEGKLFAHVRFGQGGGLALRPTYVSTPNTTAFPTAFGGSDPHAIVAQAWYQLTVPLPASQAASKPGGRIEITAGKIDPFAFFDQNAAADDETVRFLNNAFVHNPLLDSGGDVGADAYGFTPGVRIAYASGGAGQDSWSASIGVLGSGPNATLTGSPSDAFVIVQLETMRTFIAGRPGTYRVYAWHNGRAGDFADALERHSGWGLSADQQIGDAVTLFTRMGGEIDGHVRFDRALTLGVEIGGANWGRVKDTGGFAAGFLRTSNAYRDATADGTLAGYAASGTERIAELYYRFSVGDHFDVTPDVQWIQRPGGDGSAPAVVVVGVRMRVAF
jgi:hypothetical protein